MEDQERINKFSRLNTRRHELNAEIKHLKKLKEDVDEASGETFGLFVLPRITVSPKLRRPPSFACSQVFANTPASCRRAYAC